MIYLSKPNGTHGVFVRGASCEVHKLKPGFDYRAGPGSDGFVGSRGFLSQAKEWADVCDETMAARVE